MPFQSFDQPFSGSEAEQMHQIAERHRVLMDYMSEKGIDMEHYLPGSRSVFGEYLIPSQVNAASANRTQGTSTPSGVAGVSADAKSSLFTNPSVTTQGNSTTQGSDASANRVATSTEATSGSDEETDDEKEFIAALNQMVDYGFASKAIFDMIRLHSDEQLLGKSCVNLIHLITLRKEPVFANLAALLRVGYTASQLRALIRSTNHEDILSMDVNQMMTHIRHIVDGARQSHIRRTSFASGNDSDNETVIFEAEKDCVSSAQPPLRVSTAPIHQMPRQLSMDEQLNGAAVVTPEIPPAVLRVRDFIVSYLEWYEIFISFAELIEFLQTCERKHTILQDMYATHDPNHCPWTVDMVVSEFNPPFKVVIVDGQPCVGLANFCLPWVRWTGAAAAGGSMSGAAAAGGSMSGAAAAGGSMSGAAAAGGSMSGAAAAGGSMSGAAAAAGATAGSQLASSTGASTAARQPASNIRATTEVSTFIFTFLAFPLSFLLQIKIKLYFVSPNIHTCICPCLPFVVL
jgi:hypothetical protein